MTKLHELLVVTEEQKKAILDYYGKTEQDLEEDVKIIKEWAEKNPHLPHGFLTDSKIKTVMMNSKMSIERTKQNIEGYFRIRAQYADFFDRLVPNTEDFNKARKYVMHTVMPKLTPDLCRITINKFTDPQGEADDALMYYITTLMIVEMRIRNDYFLSNIIIADLDGYNMKNFLKFTPTVNQKLSNMLNSVQLRLKQIHLVNAPSFMDTLMPVLKSVLPSKIFSKIHVHKDYESLHKFVPKEYLPSDYGGSQKSLADLYDDWCEELKNSEAMFKQLLGAKSKEELRYERDDKAIFGMGSDGSFKKLAID